MLEIIKNYSCNYTHVESYILPKCCEVEEPKNGQLCIAVHTITNNIHNTNPLDKPHTIVQSSEHCLT